MVLDRGTGEISHCRFNEIIDYLDSKDLLILNNTRVIPARLWGRRVTGGKIEILLLREISPGIWDALVRRSGKMKPGEEINFSPALRGRIEEKFERGKIRLRFTGRLDLWKELGTMPLPPYIRREADERDQRDYQTVYAACDGAVAAPTAGLHFSKRVLRNLQGKGVEVDYLTIHVGWGSFQPVKAENVSEHKMEEEYYEVSRSLCDRIKTAKSKGGRIVAVGTSTVRALETAACNGNISPSAGFTGLFIYPPFRFKVIDGLITNFHLPMTTLLMLVSAFAGRERILNAYQEAVREKYRFYSYGDAMLII